MPRVPHYTRYHYCTDRTGSYSTVVGNPEIWILVRGGLRGEGGGGGIIKDGGVELPLFAFFVRSTVRKAPLAHARIFGGISAHPNAMVVGREWRGKGDGKDRVVMIILVSFVFIGCVRRVMCVGAVVWVWEHGARV